MRDTLNEDQPETADLDPNDEVPEDPHVVADAGSLPGEHPIDEVHPADRPIASFADLTRDYGDVRALGPLDATIEGRVVGLLGPNGAGKSTLIRLMLGLLRPTTGTVEVLGRPVQPGANMVAKRIGYAPEGEAAFPHLTGIESVAYAGRLVGMGRADSMQRAHQVLDYVGLEEARYRRVEQYSTGMRQRLKIAQALVHDPELLILDEPTEGVDPQARNELLDLIDELSTSHGIRILLSTHLLADVERLATHAVVIDKGAIVAQGSLDELRTAGQTGFVVRVVGDPSPLTKRLEDAGITWSRMEPSIRVEAADAGTILQHVQAAGLVVRHLAPVQMRLDEAFEQAVGGGVDA